MTGLVDLHILSYNSNPDWLAQSIHSVPKDYGINVFLIEGGFEDSIGQARAHAFNLGDAPYVTYLDDDDWLVDDFKPMLDICIKEMDSNPNLSQIYTDYNHINAKTGRIMSTTNKSQWSPTKSLVNIFEILHFHLFRREAVTPHLERLKEFRTYEEAFLVNAICDYGPAKKLDLVAYNKRTNGQSMRLASNELFKKAINLAAPSVMKHAKSYNNTMITVRREVKKEVKIPTEEELLRKYVPCRGCLGY